MRESLEEALKVIANHYGKDEQLHQLMEECCELAMEANHSYRKNSLTVNLINEIADVEIMIAQIKYLFGINEKDIDEAKEVKINRQLNRMGN